MKHFTFRLFLIRKLIESLMASCIDEYTEFEEIADGLAKAHSEMEKRRNPEPVDLSADDHEIAKRMSAIIKSGDCRKAATSLGMSGNDFCKGCFDMVYHVNTRPDYWDCNDEQKSAKRWLAEHGIKE